MGGHFGAPHLSSQRACAGRRPLHGRAASSWATSRDRAPSGAVAGGGGRLITTPRSPAIAGAQLEKAGVGALRLGSAGRGIGIESAPAGLGFWVGRRPVYAGQWIG